jgi:hypothetical protein
MRLFRKNAKFKSRQSRIGSNVEPYVPRRSIPLEISVRTRDPSLIQADPSDLEAIAFRFAFSDLHSVHISEKGFVYVVCIERRINRRKIPLSRD